MQFSLPTFPLPMLAVDGALQIVACSQRALAIFGIRGRESSGDYTQEQLGAAIGADNELSDQLALATARLVRPGDEDAFTWQYRDRTYEVRVYKTEDSGDAFLVVFEDETDRAISEEILFNARHYLEHILSNIPLGVIVLNRTLRITSINRQEIQFLERLGFKLSLVDAIGATLAELLPTRPGPEWHRMCEAVVESDERQEDRQVYAAGTGDLVLATGVIPLPDQQGRVGGALLVCEDVTEHTRLEQELVRVEKLATVGQMVVTINHEINNPLSIISTNAQSLRLLNPDLDEKIVDKLHGIERQVKRISEVTQRLRALQEVDTDEYIAEGPRMIDVWKKPPED